jgi:DNA-binding MarR family transcriptional regulator
LQPIVKSAPHADPLPPLELERFLPYRLSVLANTMSASIAAVYAERFELTIPEWRVLAVLALQPGLSAAQVADRTAMDKVAVSRAVTALARARRLERLVEASDRRRSHLQLTPRGEALYREVVPLARAYEDAVLRGLPARARHKLDVLLEELQRRARSLRATRLQAGTRTRAAGATPTDSRPIRIAGD